MSPVLVIAGTSFVGRGVCAELARQGRPVVVTARKAGGHEHCDLLDASLVEAVIRKHRPGAVVQCAGVIDAPTAGAFYQMHVTGTLHLLEAVRKHAPEATVVLLGSAAEYGPVAAETLPVQETHPTRPDTFYGASKLAQTQLGLVAVSSWGLHVKTARLFNVIGPGLPGRYFLASIIQRLRSAPAGAPFPVANLRATRDFVDLDDVAAAVALLLKPEIPPGIYNVASGCETSLHEVVRYLAELVGGLTLAESEPVAGRVNSVRSCGDSSTLRALGWQPRRHWRDSVAACWRASSLSESVIER